MRDIGVYSRWEVILHFRRTAPSQLLIFNTFIYEKLLHIYYDPGFEIWLIVYLTLLEPSSSSLIVNF